MAADPAIVALQTQINRYAKAGKFPTVNTNGIWGPLTKAGTTNALAVIQKDPVFEQLNRDAATKFIVERGYDAPGLTLSRIAFFLGNVANTYNTYLLAGGAGVAVIPVATGGGSGPSVQVKTIPPSGGDASTIPPSATFHQGAASVGMFGMPKWMTYVGGGGLALIVLMMITKRKKPSAPSAPVAGYKRR
jgi:hypothetical protein